MGTFYFYGTLPFPYGILPFLRKVFINVLTTHSCHNPHEIYRVHGNNHPELEKLYKLFHELKTEVELHLIKEEINLFPKIKKYEAQRTEELLDELIGAIGQLENEHDASGQILKELRDITQITLFQMMPAIPIL